MQRTGAQPAGIQASSGETSRNKKIKNEERLWGDRLRHTSTYCAGVKVILCLLGFPKKDPCNSCVVLRAGWVASIAAGFSCFFWVLIDNY
jgi:hypothetical protein